MEALIALGSNIDPDRNLPRALRTLAGLTEIQAQSGLWRTPPQGPVAGGDFLNAVQHVDWHGDVRALQVALKRIERSFGRAPDSSWKARTIDLDVVAVRADSRKDWTVLDEGLADKPFLLQPLAEVAPTLNLGNRSVADLAKAVRPQDAHVVELRTR